MDICTCSIHQFGCWFCGSFQKNQDVLQHQINMSTSGGLVKRSNPTFGLFGTEMIILRLDKSTRGWSCLLIICMAQVKIVFWSSWNGENHELWVAKGPLFATSHDCRHRLSNLQHGIQNKEGCKLKPKQGGHWCFFCALNFWLFWSWQTALNQRIWRESQYRLHLPCCPFQL